MNKQPSSHKKLPLRLGQFFFALDLVFWIVLLFSSLIFSEDALTALTFAPVFWYQPASTLLTSVSWAFFADLSFPASLVVLAVVGSLQHFAFGYLVGFLIDSCRRRA